MKYEKKKKMKLWCQRKIFVISFSFFFQIFHHNCWLMSAMHAYARNKEFAPCCGLMSECAYYSLGSIGFQPNLCFFDRSAQLSASWYFQTRSRTLIARKCQRIQKFHIIMTGATHSISLMVFQCKMENCLTSTAGKPRLAQLTIFNLVFSYL